MRAATQAAVGVMIRAALRAKARSGSSTKEHTSSVLRALEAVRKTSPCNFQEQPDGLALQGPVRPVNTRGIADNPIWRGGVILYKFFGRPAELVLVALASTARGWVVLAWYSFC